MVLMSMTVLLKAGDAPSQVPGQALAEVQAGAVPTGPHFECMGPSLELDTDLLPSPAMRHGFAQPGTRGLQRNWYAYVFWIH